MKIDNFKTWQKYAKETKNQLLWYIDNNSYNYYLRPCKLTCNYGMVRWVESGNLCSTFTLSPYSQGIDIKYLFVDIIDAEKKLKHLNKLYHHTFKYTPQIQESTLVKHKEKLLFIEKEITKCLQNYPNFQGVSFYETSSNNIQIHGYHKEFPNYFYGDTITINFNSPNYKHSIIEFINMWKLHDTLDIINSKKKIINSNEQYGWD